MRKDHLMIVTDAGATLHLGWDYGIPYYIDPINGVDVDLQLSQGVNQIGSTVERQSVAGVYRTITGKFWSGDADTKTFLTALPYFTSGTLYLCDTWFTRFVISKTPYLTQLDPYPAFTMMIYCDRPYWYTLEERSYTLGGYSAAFEFPVCYDTHAYGRARDARGVNVFNPGGLAVPFTATLRCVSGEVANPRISNQRTGDFIGLSGLTLEEGQTVEIYRTTSNRIAVKETTDGAESNIFSLLDEDSTLTELAAGDNLLQCDADSGVNNLQVDISFYPMESGVLPGVMA